MLEVNSAAVSNVAYDLVGEVADKARITRGSAASILAGIAPDGFAMFRVNPEEFIVKTAALIVDEKARMVVEHIRYNRAAGTYDAAEIFCRGYAREFGTGALHFAPRRTGLDGVRQRYRA